MYIEKYWGDFIGGSDDSLTFVSYLAKKQKKEIPVTEIFADCRVGVPLFKILMINLFYPGIDGENVSAPHTEQQYAIRHFGTYAFKRKQLPARLIAVHKTESGQVEV